MEKTNTPAVEDYLETIYKLSKSKGYAKVVDISQRLRVRPPTVTSMLQKLDKRGLVKYEKYREISLTPAGERIAKNVSDTHSKMMEFLTLIGVDEKTAYADTEGAEHHIHPSTIKRINRLVLFAENNPKWAKKLKNFIK
ncbi:MAG: transcriptional regulator MntR [Candidatus Aenigmarchaeota archaeon]|nr:transcriptional regulator MntR [Candidatus Aenigmarchaeota archaeon]